MSGLDGPFVYNGTIDKCGTNYYKLTKAVYVRLKTYTKQKTINAQLVTTCIRLNGERLMLDNVHRKIDWILWENKNVNYIFRKTQLNDEWRCLILVFLLLNASNTPPRRGVLTRPECTILSRSTHDCQRCLPMPTFIFWVEYNHMPGKRARQETSNCCNVISNFCDFEEKFKFESNFHVFGSKFKKSAPKTSKN